MADKIVKRGVVVYIDDTAVENSIKSVKEELRRAVNIQANAVKGTEEWIAAGKKVARLKSVLAEHVEKQKEIEREYSRMGEAADGFNEKKEKAFSLSKLAGGFNKYFGLISSFVAGITGMTLGARKAVDEFAKLEESEANIMKYTGMARDEIKEPGEAFKKRDTRTARTELNAPAAGAGRLGIKSRKDLLDFAEAGNIIKIALVKI
jgi:hypothetical protein